MRKSVKLHWASSKPNFGDCLSPLICEAVSGKPVEYSPINRCDLVSTGSLLQRLKEKFWNIKVNVWGSGFIEDCTIHKSKHIFHAVRGKKSASLLSNKNVHAFGDPGLLCSELVPKTGNRIYDYGIVPHYKDQDTETLGHLSNLIPNAKIINVFDPPLKVISEIQQCNFILSSSLHGLVTADAFEIPNQWIELSDKIRGGGWKFKDYYSVFDIDEPVCLPITKNTKELELIKSKTNYIRPNILKIKEDLVKAFPDL